MPLAVWKLCKFLAVCSAIVLPASSNVIYTNQFAIHVQGAPDIARELANKHGYTYLGQIFDGYHHLQHHKITKRSTTQSVAQYNKLADEPQVTWFSQQTLRKRVKRDNRRLSRLRNATFTDPLWPQMWYLNRGAQLDMNVDGAWKQGLSGKGVVVTILDDGLEKDHPDITPNYDPLASYDVNNHDENPEPRYDVMDSNRHGTRCAGEVAAIANNSICAVGVAFEASVGGVRMLDGDVTDAVEAQSLGLNPDHIDIYSASWGPDDDGKTVDGPGELATKAFIKGVEKGRNGLGSIFVWASGNGGREHDNCNCDGYTNSIWTLSISSTTEYGLVPWYSEACSSTLATTYSSGSSGERQIVTTDLHHKCTTSHTGTSASAPLAAGICALALQANKKLTWRDMQHIVVRTARPENLHSKDWKINGVGRNVSHSFGYGLMDATAMVNLAKNWQSVVPQKLCEVRAERHDKIIPPKSHVELSLNVQCKQVRFLEHVQAKITLTAVRRGDLHIYLTSPSGTRSSLLAMRPMDNSRSGFVAWPFMTVHAWGENPNGSWLLEVHNEAKYYGRATLKEWSLILYGTATDPDVNVNTSYSNKEPSLAATMQPELTRINSNLAVTQPSSSSNPKKYLGPPYFPNKGRTPYGYNNNALRNQDEKVGLPVPLNDLEPAIENSNRNQVSPEGGESVTMGCRTFSRNGLCLDCKNDGRILFNGVCLLECPKNHFLSPASFNQLKDYIVSSNKTSLIQKLPLVCQHCHYSCMNCSGPNDYDCSACYGDSLLNERGFCFPSLLLLRLSRTHLQRNLAVALGALISFFILGRIIYHLLRKYYSSEMNGSKRGIYRILPAKVTEDDLGMESN